MTLSTSRLPFRLAWLTAAFLALALAGCASKPKQPQPANLALSAVAAADLNPDDTGRPSPLVLRVYALRSLAEFDKADFFALYDRDEQVLAADLVKRDEIIIQPGRTVTLEREFTPDVKFVAVLGAFRDVTRAKWRASAEIPAGAQGVLIVKADASSVSVAIESSR